METSGSAWSNLIIPYQTSIAYHTLDQSKTESKRENVGLTENEKKEDKKKNPYSIEELLKKPTKRVKPLDVASFGFHQPFGVVLENDNETNVEIRPKSSCFSTKEDDEEEENIEVEKTEEM